MHIESQTLENIKKEDFLIKNNLTDDDFLKSRLNWDELLRIGVAHAESFGFLKETAIMLSSVLQQVNEVHSVRWRVKDPEHLMAKIVRKRIDENEKYNDISSENYTGIVTDLIGIRVLHLFKKDWNPIHNFITSMSKLAEDPVVYIREGDDSESEEYRNQGCEVKIHKAGYRSAHYITTTRPMKDKIFTEIQVRTIFEEGWSEIDHRVRYPNFSDNELLNYFLMIFNRFSGSADEMGSFVLDLRETIELMELTKMELSRIENEKAESLQKIDELIVKLSSEQEKAGKASNELQELRKEMDILKRKEETTSRNKILKSFELKTNEYNHEKIVNEAKRRLATDVSSHEALVSNARKEMAVQTGGIVNEKINSLLSTGNSRQQKMLREFLGTKEIMDSLYFETPKNSYNDLKVSPNKNQNDNISNSPLKKIINKKLNQPKKN